MSWGSFNEKLKWTYLGCGLFGTCLRFLEAVLCEARFKGAQGLDRCKNIFKIKSHKLMDGLKLLKEYRRGRSVLVDSPLDAHINESEFLMVVN